jgi:hypothetical protein
MLLITGIRDICVKTSGDTGYAIENKICLNGMQIGQIEKKVYCWRSTRREKLF